MTNRDVGNRICLDELGMYELEMNKRKIDVMC